MLRFVINAMGGTGIGFLLGALLGGVMGFVCVSAGYSAPNGNPTEIEFFHFLQNGLGIVLAIVGAIFGGGIGAALGAACGVAWAGISRSKAQTAKQLPPDSNPNRT
jgi:hypothetical protein